MKAYVKPELYFESYELSQHIAVCGINVNYPNENVCDPKLDKDFWYEDDQVFNAGREWCTTDIDVIEQYCYTTGTDEGGKLFNS